MTGLRTFHDTEPVAVTDKVRDVMLFTVPGLKDEEDDPIVAPDIPMRDDGAERIFVKAYIHDEIPWMDVSNEVRDLMFLAVPSINVPAEDLMFADAEIPLDDMDGSWFSEAETVTEAVTQQEEVPTTDADADVQPMVSAPSTAVAIAAPEVRIGIHAPAEVCMLTMPEPVMALAEPVPSVDTVPVETARVRRGPRGPGGVRLPGACGDTHRRYHCDGAALGRGIRCPRGGAGHDHRGQARGHVLLRIPGGPRERLEGLLLVLSKRKRNRVLAH